MMGRGMSSEVRLLLQEEVKEKGSMERSTHSKAAGSGVQDGEGRGGGTDASRCAVAKAQVRLDRARQVVCE